MKGVAPAVSTSLLVGVCCVSSAYGQIIKDSPWNPDHINHLPAEVRSEVLAMCATTPQAGHYFATYYQDRITLHFESFHCDTGPGSFCSRSLCLHKIYRLSAGHYRLVETVYGPRND